MFGALFLALSVVTLGIGLSQLRRARSLSDGSRRRETLIAIAIFGPFAWGAVEAALSLTVFPKFETTGLWRLAGVAVLAYGLARWRFYDLPQRTTRAAAAATGATAATA